MTQVDQNTTGDGNQVIGQVVSQVVNLTVYDQIPQVVSQGAVIASKPLTQQEYRQRTVLLNKVKEYWIKGVLERSLHSQVILELGLEEKPEMVQRPFREADEFAVNSGQIFPEGTSATSLFDEMEAGRTLLILGEPGSGKTITLLKLAENLVARAEADLSQPIPVVVNLSSWRKKEKSFAAWLVDELFEKYQVSKSTGQDLIKKEALILLLDGLDEVSLELREQCVSHLNQFIQGHGSTEISICCRVRDYEKLSQRLMLRCSIYIHPLSFGQVDEYLSQAGEQLSSLRKILETDLELKTIATTPLILSIMSMAYQYYVLEDFQSLPSTGERRQHLLDSYVERMLHRRDSSHEYSREQVKYWLSWLAKNMQQRSNTIFLIERLQPAWLSSKSKSIQYRFFSAFLAAALTGGFIAIVYILGSGFEMGILSGTIWGLGYGAIVAVLGDIQTVENLEISFRIKRERLFTSSLIGLASGILVSFHIEAIGAISAGIAIALLVLCVGQLRGSITDKVDRPNQSIWKSLHNSLQLGLGVFFSVTILYAAIHLFISQKLFIFSSLKCQVASVVPYYSGSKQDLQEA